MTLRPRETKTYHVFLASPGDCHAERQAIHDFFDLTNRTFGALFGVRFEVLDWKTHSDRGAGRPQARITHQTLERYRDSLVLVLGLMAQRFGMPSGAADSGTQEEFDWAAEQLRTSGRPDIKWFFRRIERFVSEPENEKIQEAFDQWKKVQDFRRRMDEGSPRIFYGWYPSDDKFADILHGDLQFWLTDPDRPWNAPPAEPVAQAAFAQFVPSRLVPPPLDFTGRAREVDQIVQRLVNPSRPAVVVIHGMGGAGKTTLAQAVARDARLSGRFTGGELRLDMRGLDANPPRREELLRAILPQLGASPELPDNALLGEYHKLLGERPTLILADNAGDASQLKDFIPASPSAIVVTSRRAIPLENATAISLQEWNSDRLPTAMTILSAMIGNARKEPLTDVEAAAVARACGELPGPLRAAASLLKTDKYHRVQHFLDDLTARRAVIEDESGRDFRASLSLSVEALAAQDAPLVAAWRRLAVFPDDFDVAAAASVAGLSDSEMASALDRLLANSLVERVADEDRYRLHDLYRQLALEELGPDQAPSAKLAHAAYFGKWVAACAHRFEQSGQIAALAAFDRERANIEVGWLAAASNEAEGEDAARILVDYGAFTFALLRMRISATVRAEWHARARNAASRLSLVRAEAWSNGGLGVAYENLGDHRKAIRCHTNWLEMSRQSDDRPGEARANGNLGIVYQALGEYRKAIEHQENDLNLSLEMADRAGVARATGNLGVSYHWLGEFHKAIEYQMDHLRLAVELEDRAGEASANGNLGNAFDALGEHLQAIERHERHLMLARELKDRQGEAQALWNRGLALYQDGQVEGAIVSLEESLGLARKHDLRWPSWADERLRQWKTERDRRLAP